jgi:hypothetical protein
MCENNSNISFILDGGDFQGHVTIVNLNTNSQVVYNVLCSNISTHLRDYPGTSSFFRQNRE